MVLPAMPPQLVITEIDKYANEVLRAFQALDIADIDQVALFLADAFYRLTSIHPFANGNGRVATCIMNTFLRALNLPSILLRLPGEKENLTSLYTQAMTRIEESREPLQQLIKTKIEQETIKPFEDLKALHICETSIEILTKLEDLMARDYPIDDIFRLGRFPLYASDDFVEGRSEDNLREIQLAEMLRIINLLLGKKSLAYHGMFAAAASALEPSQQDFLKTNLNSLTDNLNWKYAKKENFAWLKCKDKREALQIIDKFALLGDGLDSQLSYTKVKGSCAYVVKYIPDADSPLLAAVGGSVMTKS